MPIDPKKIAECRAAVERVTSGGSWAVMLEPVAADALRATRNLLPALLAEHEEMLALLREVQWSGPNRTCPVCGIAEKPAEEASHAIYSPDCRLAAVLTP